jgi:undecaprenyl pyrophosphate phosphatase UppP
LGLPTIFGAWLLTFVKASYAFNPEMIIPAIVSFAAGLIAINILINFTLNAKLKYFAFYCMALSATCLGY